MKKIKLEVGKTYRSREGKEVRIVRKTANGRPPYQGNNGNWYTESGRWDNFGTWHSEDLIEEVPETQHTFALVAEALTASRHTFSIPDGVKKVTVEQCGNRIIVEMVPKEGPKPGDILVNKWGSVYIFKEVRRESHEYFACLGRDGRVYYHSVAIPGRPATPEEVQPLWDALKKAGKRWNPHTMVVEEKITEYTRILEWVEVNIKDGYYNHEDVAEAIEAYLKHKEGKK